MGDVLTLIEKAQANVDEDHMQSLGKRAAKGQLDLNDFVQQMATVRSMGPLSDLIGMIPGVGGMGQIKRQLQGKEIDDTFFRRWEAIVQSMTPAERHNPDIIGGSRRKRIADGSGTTPADVNQLLKQWKEMKKAMQSMASGKFGKMMGLR
jgi:signal recognition particle subunit SRP54